MKIRFLRNSNTPFWHGFGKSESSCCFDVGIIAIDWYASIKSLSIYFWKFEIEIDFGAKK